MTKPFSHGKPFKAFASNRAFTKKVGQALRMPDGTIGIVVSVTKPRYLEDQARYSYEYTTRAATPEESEKALAADNAAKAAKEKSTKDSMANDDDRHAK